MSDKDASLDVLVKAAMDKIEGGSISLKDVLIALSPAQVSADAPAILPVPTQITAAQHQAVEKVSKVFGQVVPVERRTLSSTEIAALVEEKETLDELKKMAEGRQENIRITVFNHFDVEAEDMGTAEGVLRDSNGFYILGGEARGEPDTPKKFTREVRQGSPTLNASALKALADDPEVEDFTHEDYLKMTTQTRVFDESKVILAMKKNPTLAVAISKAINPGNKTNSMNLRKA